MKLTRTPGRDKKPTKLRRRPGGGGAPLVRDKSDQDGGWMEKVTDPLAAVGSW